VLARRRLARAKPSLLGTIQPRRVRHRSARRRVLDKLRPRRSSSRRKRR
jgi:hypothetical protein